MYLASLEAFLHTYKVPIRHLSETLTSNACMIKSNENEKSRKFLYFYFPLFILQMSCSPLCFCVVVVICAYQVERVSWNSFSWPPRKCLQNVYYVLRKIFVLFCFVLISFVQYLPVYILGSLFPHFRLVVNFSSLKPLNSTNASLGKTTHLVLGNGISMHVHVWSVIPVSPSHTT